MGVNHGGRHILVPEQFLDRADVGAALECVRGETVPKRVAADALGQTNSGDRGFDRAMNRHLVEMVPANLP